MYGVWSAESAMSIRIRWTTPQIVEIGDYTDAADLKMIEVAYRDNGESFTVPEVLRAAADWYEKSDNPGGDKQD